MGKSSPSATSLLFTVLVAACSQPLSAEDVRCKDATRRGAPTRERVERIRAAPSQTCLPQYTNLVDTFRSGDRAQAFAELREWSFERLGEVILYLQAEPAAMKLDHILAAVLLHTDAAFDADREGDDAFADVHISLARELLEVKGVQRSSWHREWLLLMGYSHQRPGVQPDDGPSMDYFQECLALFPDDSEALLATGSLLEGFGRLTSRRSKMRQAERLYERALSKDPSSVEAHLRLAAALAAQGQDEASAVLAWVFANTRDPYVLYLAHLLQGDVHKGRDRFLEAVQSYRAAVSTRPEWQVACISLSHALDEAGSGAEARKVVEQCLEIPVDRETYEDGWSRYQMGLSDRFDIIFERWRKHVTR